jgi:hypothetical protein
MAKPACRLALAPEATQPLGVVSHFARKHFYGDLVTEKNVSRLIDRSHSPTPKQGLDAVLTVEIGIDKRGGIILEHLAIQGAEAHGVVIL